MNRQRTRTRDTSERSIKSIRVVSREKQEEKEGHAPTSRRSSSQIKNDITPLTKISKGGQGYANKRVNHDEVETHRNRKLSCYDQNKENFGQRMNAQGQSIKKDYEKSVNNSQTPRSQNEEEYIHKMLEKLGRKQQRQLESIKKLCHIPQSLHKAHQINGKLREQLLQMKQLMKALLLERQESRMFNFYLDQ